MRELARRIDAWQDRFGRGVSWLSLAMVVVVFGDVLSRYLFGVTSTATQELEWYLFGTLYLLAAGYTLLHDEHVRVDILYSQLSPRRKAWLDFVLLWVFFFPSCLLVIYTAWPFVRDSWASWEGSSDPGGIPARWALKSMIILGFLGLLLQGVSEAIKTFYWAKGWETPPRRGREVPR
jgi:TRAP-type mannitol/chloroaromatic compound transport system permease small subunit